MKGRQAGMDGLDHRSGCPLQGCPKQDRRACSPSAATPRHVIPDSDPESTVRVRVGAEPSSARRVPMLGEWQSTRGLRHTGNLNSEASGRESQRDGAAPAGPARRVKNMED
jgi:hypothetical protein